MSKILYKFIQRDSSGSLYLNKNEISSVKQKGTSDTEIHMTNGDQFIIANTIDIVIKSLGESEEKRDGSTSV